MGDMYPKLKVAAVQAASVFLDRRASVEKACKLIKEAGRKGADLAVFPEGFIPAHPVWYHFHSCTSAIANNLSGELFKNSVEVPGEEVEELCRVAEENNIYVAMGICEKTTKSTGTMYNSQIIISSEGKLIGKRQKIMPTIGERLVHKGGSGANLKTYETELGPISALMCSENSNPLALFTLAAESTRIHAMAWPSFWAMTSKPMRKYVSIATHNFAQVAKCFVISSCGTVDEESIDKMELSDQEKEFLNKPENSGGSLIVGPDAETIAGPMDNKEGIIYADIDIEDCILPKLVHDFAGHYNRGDIFQLHVNRGAPELLKEEKFPK